MATENTEHLTIGLDPAQQAAILAAAKPKRTFGEAINGSKKFLLSLATIAGGCAVAVLTYETNIDLANKALELGLGVGGGGLALTGIIDGLKLFGIGGKSNGTNPSTVS